jgi:hypothetical protein
MGRCADGTSVADGTDCDADGMAATRDVCVAGACGATRCGDGYADATTMEECDDGNDAMGDGCDDCRFSCETAADCSDGEDCNGEEVCSAAHVCGAGTALTDGAMCNGTTGTCMGGACLSRTCATDPECADANVCNGTETCDGGTMACARGAPLSCDDGNACTSDACNPTLGCSHTLVDGDRDGHSPTSAGACGDDCDDARDDVHPDASDVCDGADNDCDTRIDEGGVTTWYADCDADGYAAMGARTIMSCVPPAPGLAMCATGGGWTTRQPMGAGTADCNDGNAAVHPGQTMYQTSAIAGAPPASDYDYDCDGMEEQRDTARGMCASIGIACVPATGWFGDEPTPACGAPGTYLLRCTASALSCTPVTETRTQACL